jgi:hypothetical protein
VLLVSLHVLTKLNTSVRLVVDVLAGHYGTRAEGAGDATFVRKGIELEDAQEDHLNHHFGGVHVRKGLCYDCSGCVP